MSFAATPDTHPIPRPDALAVADAFAPLPPFINAPLPAARSLAPMAVRPWLPPANLAQPPRLLPVDRQLQAPLRPTADRPEIAQVPPLVRFMPTGSGAYAVAPDPADALTVRLGPDAAPGLSPRTAALPAARQPQAPRWLPSSLQWAMNLRPLPDATPTERAADPFEIRPPRMLVRPLAVAACPDPTVEPIVSRAFLPVPDRPAFSADPTWHLSRQAASARPPELVRPAAQFRPLAIPDPFETRNLVALRAPLPDADPPSPAPGMPPRPTLPVNP